MANRTKESREEKDSRQLLIRFLTVTDKLLDRILEDLLSRARTASNVSLPQLRIIWKHARVGLRNVIKSVRIGLSRARRKALESVGMFGEVLKAKYQLFEIDIKENAVKRVLKSLNSLLGSFARVFAPLHAVKEFKEHVEIVVDHLKKPIEFITLADIR